MRILYLDLDSLRPDHLGCYGYHRNTSPNIDHIASEGVCFENCYASDVPCLPSRTALFSGRFGIHTGVVNHGGEAADFRLEGKDRGFRSTLGNTSWMSILRKYGFHTVSISPFAERHSAWHFYAGFSEMYNTGKGGMEIADDVTPIALDWIKKNAKRDNWFLHINYWDPHGPYRIPERYGNPFKNDPPPDWYNEEIRKAHFNSYGPHSAHEPLGWDVTYPWDKTPPPIRYPRMPVEIASIEDYRRWIDGYDVGIRYMDDHIGRLLNILKKEGVLEDTVIIISADHGENQGELNIYGDHQTADHLTCHIPLIIRWPGLKKGVLRKALHYNLDLPPTIIELLGEKSPSIWDGKSFSSSINSENDQGQSFLVVSQCAWSCQRGVRFDKWLLIRTYHSGIKNLPEIMLFDIENDPHELNNLAPTHEDIVKQGLGFLEKWHAEMMAHSDSKVDPLSIVIKEGGPFHTRRKLEDYCRRLRETNRQHHAEMLEKYISKQIRNQAGQ